MSSGKMLGKKNFFFTQSFKN